MPRIMQLPRQRARRKNQSPTPIGAISLLAQPADGASRDKEVARRLYSGIAPYCSSILTMARQSLAYSVAELATSDSKLVLGFSTAISAREHRQKFHFPTTSFSTIIYTGQDYESCQQIMMQSSDGIIILAGTDADVHVISTLVSVDVPIGILLLEGHSSRDVARTIELLATSRGIIFDSEPTSLLSRMSK